MPMSGGASFQHYTQGSALSSNWNNSAPFSNGSFSHYYGPALSRSNGAPTLTQQAPLGSYYGSASLNNLATMRTLNTTGSAPLSGYHTSASAVNLPLTYAQNYSGSSVLNRDPNPLVIHKRSQPVHYKQQVGVRFIKPEPLPPHGDILVKHLPDTQLPPGPPVYMRNNPPPPLEQPTQIIREQPPPPPPQLPDQVYTIPGRRIQAPRKVIVECYAEVPIPRTECRVVYDTPCLLVQPSEAVCF